VFLALVSPWLGEAILSWERTVIHGCMSSSMSTFERLGLEVYESSINFSKARGGGKLLLQEGDELSWLTHKPGGRVSVWVGLPAGDVERTRHPPMPCFGQGRRPVEFHFC
jgi:hypothetical protein